MTSADLPSPDLDAVAAALDVAQAVIDGGIARRCLAEQAQRGIRQAAGGVGGDAECVTEGGFGRARRLPAQAAAAKQPGKRRKFEVGSGVAENLARPQQARQDEVQLHPGMLT